MQIDISSLDAETTHQIAISLQDVLNERTHRKQHLGAEVIVAGSLSKALNLPLLISHLAGKSGAKHLAATEKLAEIWVTLSPLTQQKVLSRCNIYNPEEMDWEDPRSNRWPLV
ncbi:Uncharacterised protein [BD1-7 clade bacterium]|uniref:Uncharacterized protein n=1 Tax=BD1-7 clade bacterium TaxID=2029982 RepID=A0A5S9QM38_9GAMM|nr:Uncharacterised protein [BD1-7 clade bacterium]